MPRKGQRKADRDPEEDERIIRFLLQARLDGGRTVTALVRACAVPPDNKGGGGLGLKVSPDRVEKLLTEGMERLAGERSRFKRFARDEQVERILRHLRRMLTSDKPNMHQVMRAEELLADLLGNRAPSKIEVDAHLHGALATIVAIMTPDRKEELMQQMRERLLGARAGTRVPPALQPPTIELLPPARAVEGEPCVVEPSAAVEVAPDIEEPSPIDDKARVLRRHQEFLTEQARNRSRRMGR